MCGKSPDEVQFSNSQRKRLKKGQIATCKACASPAASSGSAAPTVVAGARASSRSAGARRGDKLGTMLFDQLSCVIRILTYRSDSLEHGSGSRRLQTHQTRPPRVARALAKPKG